LAEFATKEIIASPSALKELQAKGVPEAVILAMFHARKRKTA